MTEKNTETRFQKIMRQLNPLVGQGVLKQSEATAGADYAAARPKGRKIARKAIEIATVPLFMATTQDWKKAIGDLGRDLAGKVTKLREQIHLGSTPTDRQKAEEELRALAKQNPEITRARAIVEEEEHGHGPFGAKSEIIQAEEPFDYKKGEEGYFWQNDVPPKTTKETGSRVMKENGWEAYAPSDAIVISAQQATRGKRVLEDIELEVKIGHRVVSQHGLAISSGRTTVAGFLIEGKIHHDKREVIEYCQDLTRNHVNNLEREIQRLDAEIEQEKNPGKIETLRQQRDEIGQTYQNEALEAKHFEMARAVDEIYFYLHDKARTCITRDMLLTMKSEAEKTLGAKEEHEVMQLMLDYLEGDHLVSAEEQEKWAKVFGKGVRPWEAVREVNEDPELDFRSATLEPEYRYFETEEKNKLFNDKAREHWRELYSGTREARLRLGRIQKMREFGGVPYSSNKLTVYVWEEKEIPLLDKDHRPVFKDGEMQHRRVKEKVKREVFVPKLLPTGYTRMSQEWVLQYRQLMAQGKEDQAMDLFYQAIAKDPFLQVGSQNTANELKRPGGINEFEPLFEVIDPVTGKKELSYRRPVIEEYEELDSETNKIIKKQRVATEEIEYVNPRTGEVEKKTIEKYQFVYRDGKGNLKFPERPNDEFLRRALARDADTHCLDRVRGMKGFQTLWEWQRTSNGNYSGWLYEHVGYAVMTRIFLLTSGGINPYDHPFNDIREIMVLPGRRPQISLRFIMQITGQGGPSFESKTGDGWGHLREEEFYYKENILKAGFTRKRADELSAVPGRNRVVQTFYGWATERILSRADRTDPITLALIGRGDEGVRVLHELSRAWHFGDHFYIPWLEESGIISKDWDTLSSGRASFSPAETARLLMHDMNPKQLRNLMNMPESTVGQMTPEEWYDYFWEIAMQMSTTERQRTAEGTELLGNSEDRRLNPKEESLLEKLKNNIRTTVGSLPELAVLRTKIQDGVASDDERALLARNIELLDKLEGLSLTTQIGVMVQNPKLAERLRSGFTEEEFKDWENQQVRGVLLSLCMMQAARREAERETVFARTTPAQRQQIIGKIELQMTQNRQAGRPPYEGILNDQTLADFVILTREFFEDPVLGLDQEKLQRIKEILVNGGNDAARFEFSQSHPLSFGLVKPGDVAYCNNWAAREEVGFNALVKNELLKNPKEKPKFVLTDEEKAKVKALDQNPRALIEYYDRLTLARVAFNFQYGANAGLPISGYDATRRSEQDKRYRSPFQFNSCENWMLGDYKIYYYQDAQGRPGPGFFDPKAMESGRPDLFDPFSEYDFPNTLIFTALSLMPEYTEARMRGYPKRVWLHNVLTPADWHAQHDTVLANFDGVFLSLQKSIRGMILPEEMRAIERMVPGMDGVSRFQFRQFVWGIKDVREAGHAQVGKLADWTGNVTGLVTGVIPGVGGAIQKGVGEFINDAPGWAWIGGGGSAVVGIGVGVALSSLPVIGLSVVAAVPVFVGAKVVNERLIQYQMDHSKNPVWDWPGKPEEVAQALVTPPITRYTHQHPRGG